MKNRNKAYSILTSLIIGASFHALGHAQDQQSQPNYTPSSATQSETFESAISLPSATERPASWQGQALALQGRDVVSYFQGAEPSEGSEQYSAKWDNTTWHFSTEENRDLFAENPYRYVPEFGGYCPVALASNDAKVGLSKHYTVVDQKLYLNYNQPTQDLFRSTPEDYIYRAQLNF